MNTHESNPDYPDTLLDRGLAELLGGETPPDLSECILAAHAATSEPVTLAQGNATMSTATIKQSSRLKSWTILAASIACIATFIGLSLPARNAARRLSVPDNLARVESTPSLSVTAKEQSRESAIDTGLGLRGLINNDAASSKSSDELMMTVTPHIIIHEEEEERLGIATREQLESQINAELGRRALSAPPEVVERLKRQQDHARRTSEQSGPVTQLGEVVSGGEYGGRRSAGRDFSAPSFQNSFAPEAGDGLAAAPTAGTPILSKVPYVGRKFRNLSDEFGDHGQRFYSEARPGIQAGDIPLNREHEEAGDKVRFPAQKSVPQSSMGLQGLINDAYATNPTQEGMYFQSQFGKVPSPSRDQYTPIHENPFITATGPNAVSTFSIDVDTASYANVRQFLQSGRLPPPDAVRIEELVNYFDYDYTGPTDDTPFAANMEIAGCPWNPEHRLARIAIKGKDIDRTKRPQSNLVFLIDVSGSMNDPNKLPLLVEGMKLLTRELGENDKVAIVVYASSEGLALNSTRGNEQETILTALDQLRAGGSTAGGAGINLAYQIATDHFIEGGTNRVILCTDGDFNVGVTNTDALTRLAEEKAKTGVFLTVLGFGRGNLNDAMMEAISGRGNGNYHYVDNLTEARKVLVEEMTGTLITIAKDVKIQVEFNPAQVTGYRLIGYENRMLKTEDFNNDKKDAGEIGAGHTVTALYEIVPAGKEVAPPAVDPLKYQQPLAGLAETEKNSAKPQAASDELLTLKLRYKLPDADTSTKLEFPITDKGESFATATKDFQFAAAVASFGMLLRHSEHQGDTSYDAVLEIAQSALGNDPHGYRAEFLELVRLAKALTGEQPSSTTDPSTTEGP